MTTITFLPSIISAAGKHAHAFAGVVHEGLRRVYMAHGLEDARRAEVVAAERGGAKFVQPFGGKRARACRGRHYVGAVEAGRLEQPFLRGDVVIFRPQERIGRMELDEVAVELDGEIDGLPDRALVVPGKADDVEIIRTDAVLADEPRGIPGLIERDALFDAAQDVRAAGFDAQADHPA